MNYEGHKSDLLLKEAVYRIDANTGRMMTDDEMTDDETNLSRDNKRWKKMKSM